MGKKKTAEQEAHDKLLTFTRDKMGAAWYRFISHPYNVFVLLLDSGARRDVVEWSNAMEEARVVFVAGEGLDVVDVTFTEIVADMIGHMVTAHGFQIPDA